MDFTQVLCDIATLFRDVVQFSSSFGPDSFGAMSLKGKYNDGHDHQFPLGYAIEVAWFDEDFLCWDRFSIGQWWTVYDRINEAFARLHLHHERDWGLFLRIYNSVNVISFRDDGTVSLRSFGSEESWVSTTQTIRV